MTLGWQQVVTLLLIGTAVAYLTRHLLRSMTRAPGAGCGVSTGCGGCAAKHGQGHRCNTAAGGRSTPIPQPEKIDTPR
jgi:hypothetical protein